MRSRTPWSSEELLQLEELAKRNYSLQVIALIHFEAIRLWLKRVPFHRKPPFTPGEGSARS